MSDKKSISSKIKERAFILQCIEIYKSQPALWNVKSKDYNNRQKKSDAYAILINKYREKYPEATREDVTKKFNSLRTNFRKELKRINDDKRSNASTDHVKEPTLWYFKEMSFLLEVIQNSNSTMDQFEETKKENNSTINAIIIRKIDKKNKMEKNNMHQVVKEEMTIKKRKNVQDELMFFACKCPKSSESEYDKIAKAWATELQKMSQKQQIYAKKAINDILFEGQLGNLHRNSVQIDPLTISRTSTPIYDSDST